VAAAVLAAATAAADGVDAFPAAAAAGLWMRLELIRLFITPPRFVLFRCCSAFELNSRPLPR
jgi:hypothetical protein